MDFPDESLAAHGVVAADRSEAIYSHASVSRSDVVILGRLRFPGLDPQRRYRVRPLVVGRPPTGLAVPAWWGMGHVRRRPPLGENDSLSAWGLPADGGPGVIVTGAALGSTGLMAAGMNPDHAILYRAEAVELSPFADR